MSFKQNNDDKSGFSYTYSAREQDEIKKIREKYSKKASSEDKLERLRSLDANVTRKANVISLVIGILGTLLLGLGMSLAMSELPAQLGIDGAASMLIGALIGLFGIALAALAYPVYSLVVRRERARIAPEIIRLSDELMK